MAICSLEVLTTAPAGWRILISGRNLSNSGSAFSSFDLADPGEQSGRRECSEQFCS
jgi:hypothetical protein